MNEGSVGEGERHFLTFLFSTELLVAQRRKMTFMNMRRAMTAAGAKQHPSLSYILLCLGGGIGLAMLYTTRLASSSPDVAWKDGDTPNPNERWSQKDQYKFYSPVRNYSKNPENSPKV